MKDNKHIHSFNEHQEILNISDVMSSILFNFNTKKKMKLLNWAEVHLIVKTMIENGINLNDLKENDYYIIEKTGRYCF